MMFRDDYETAGGRERLLSLLDANGRAAYDAAVSAGIAYSYAESVRFWDSRPWCEGPRFRIDIAYVIRREVQETLYSLVVTRSLAPVSSELLGELRATLRSEEKKAAAKMCEHNPDRKQWQTTHTAHARESAHTYTRYEAAVARLASRLPQPSRTMRATRATVVRHRTRDLRRHVYR